MNYDPICEWSNLTLKWAHLPMTLRHATSQDWLSDLRLAMTCRPVTCRLQLITLFGNKGPIVQVSHNHTRSDISIFIWQHHQSWCKVRKYANNWLLLLTSILIYKVLSSDFLYRDLTHLTFDLDPCDLWPISLIKNTMHGICVMQSPWKWCFDMVTLTFDLWPWPSSLT